MDLLEYLEVEHLEGEQRKLAEAIGIEAYRTLVGMYAGGVIYVPTVDKLTIKVRDNLIKKEYTGYNHRELALRYGISEQWVRVIVGAAVPTIDGQVSLFEDAPTPI